MIEHRFGMMLHRAKHIRQMRIDRRDTLAEAMAKITKLESTRSWLAAALASENTVEFCKLALESIQAELEDARREL